MRSLALRALLPQREHALAHVARPRGERDAPPLPANDLHDGADGVAAIPPRVPIRARQIGLAHDLQGELVAEPGGPHDALARDRAVAELLREELDGGVPVVLGGARLRARGGVAHVVTLLGIP